MADRRLTGRRVFYLIVLHFSVPSVFSLTMCLRSYRRGLDGQLKTEEEIKQFSTPNRTAVRRRSARWCGSFLLSH